VRFRPSLIVLLAFVFLGSSLPAGAKTSARNLAPNYRHWLEAEVPYIISTVEKKQFLSLSSDHERDVFIESFWKLRNPDPNSETNSYKEEHYRRLAYANEHFGTTGNEDGWRTDMGRMYIILGAPKQRAPYHALVNVREMEIWFYQADTPILPPFFYLLFYKRSPIDPYTLYSPREDGPVQLVSTGESRNDPARAIGILRKSGGDEVAKTAMTLIPGESVDYEHFSPSMESDMLLASINNLPDNPLTKERLDANRLREHVTMSVLTGEREAALSYSVFRDDQGRETLSYLLGMGSPDPHSVGQRPPDKSPYYDFALRTSVLTLDGKSVYDQEDSLSGKLTEAQAGAAIKKRFSAEARIPLAPGKYIVVATLTNNLNQTATRQHATVTVPAVSNHELGFSTLLAYKAPAPVPDPKNQLPFSASRLRFTPRGAESVTLRAGEKLPLVFQLWMDPRAAGAAEPEKIHLHYVFGAVTASHENPFTEDEEVDATNRDQAGNLVTGHTLDTSVLPIGTYRLVVSANRVGDHQTTYASMTLHVQSTEGFTDSWTAYGPADPEGEALDDYKRGLSAEAQGSDTEAQAWYSRSLTEGPEDMRPLDKLAVLLARHERSAELAALGHQAILVRSAAAPKTLLPIAEALKKSGDNKGVVRLLETQIQLQPPNVDLYQTLANACEATGNTARARDLRTLAAGIK